MYVIPEAKHIANHSCIVIAEVISTHDSPGVISQYLHTSIAGSWTDQTNYKHVPTWIWKVLFGLRSFDQSINRSDKFSWFDTIGYRLRYWLLTQCLRSGMTNYRIGTHRHASASNLTTSARQNRGRGIKVQFQGVNIEQAAGKVSKQMDSCRRSPSKSSNKYKYKCTKGLTHCFVRTLVARQKHTQQ